MAFQFWLEEMRRQMPGRGREFQNLLLKSCWQADLGRGQRRLQRQRLPRPAVSMVTVERDVGARTLLQALRGSEFQRSVVVVVGVTTAAAASQIAVVVEDVVAVVITGMSVARSSLLRSSFGIAVKTRLQGRSPDTSPHESCSPCRMAWSTRNTQTRATLVISHNKPARSDPYRL